MTPCTDYPSLSFTIVLFLNWVVNGRVENTEMIGIIVISREHLEANKGVDGGKNDGESVKSDGLLGWCDVSGCWVAANLIQWIRF